MPNDQKIYLEHFCYSSGLLVVPAAAGGVVNGVVNVAADADFQANYMTIAVTQAGLLVATWGGTILISDSATGKTFSNIAVPVQAYAGSGQLPYPFNPPRIFRGNSSVTITLTNNVVTATWAQIVFHGNKIRPVS